ncbi:heavy-metal-associated domain protein [Kordia sp. SMS9]|uniref:heavy-metal-associated domain-containing protein n=1 Tax=Kordia sp. SMS9 TaxID=2282170 RepID=UPI000E0DDAD4|nr:heavy-metal-associated domain-containing protein [Kordia sp. SMS9]AXG69818.1 heavy-metal-associated domain protein [Kordia sp. SMS9]
MRTSIIIQNLKCGGCVKTIITKLAELPTISEIEINTKTSTVSFTTTNTDDALEVKAKLKALGYPSIEDANSILTKAKSFVSCASGRMK